MRPLRSAELLDIWERFNRSNPVQKALSLLKVACSDGDPADPALLNIGERDLRLLQLREWMFGSSMVNIASCPACRERLEWTTPIAALRYLPPPRADSPLSFTYSNYAIFFRLPNTYDLAQIERLHHPERATKKILAACITAASRDGGVCEVADLPEDVFHLLDERMAEEDPQANIQMNLHCPHCSHEWQSRFDIVSYLWTEIDHWAKSMLLDIATLASAFGWSERDILSMSAHRRQLYLQIIRK
ncbi:MAG: hypothetical protein ABW007_02225 [Chitinophagaceae bacterium]